MSITTLHGFVRAGRLSDALRLFAENSALRSAENSILFTELLYYTGNRDEAGRRASDLLRQTSDDSVASRSALIVAACRYEEGDFKAAVELCREALHFAEVAKDCSLAALAASQLLEKVGESEIDGQRPLAAVARRYTLRAADPQVAARVHLSFGRLEGRTGNLDVALRHLTVARDVLKADDNLWISSAIELDRATVIALFGDFEEALRLTIAASEQAAQSGWSKGQAMAAANIAYLCVMLGKENDALRWLKTTPPQFRNQPSYRAAIAETLAQAEFCREDFAAAELLLGAPDPGPIPNLKWYEVQRHITQSQILLARGEWMSAKTAAETGIGLAHELGHSDARLTLMLCRAEAMAGLKVAPSPADIDETLEQRGSVELVGHALIVKGKALLGQNCTEAGTEQLARGARLFKNIGSAPTRVRAALAGRVHPAITVDRAPSTLDSAVALLDLAGHPHILGPEAMAVLRGTECVQAAALVVASRAGTRIVETIGWTETEAAAADKNENAAERLPLGKRTDETWTLLVRPKRDLEPYCTFASIRRLLAIALSLDGYRRDEKQRGALWPADSLDGDQECIWASEQMTETLSIARRVAASPLSVLITGETGTGKEMLARAIHRASDRAERPFLPFNCTAVPREMLESQLFGYRKGAFTGAEAPFAGVIRSAAGGTLFLDEIGEIGPEIQPKLLRFLETHEIHPLSEPHPVKVDVRVIAATNASVEQLIAGGRFREDLFYRLNVVRLAIPPLRERREEIPPLVHHYVRKYADEQRKGRISVTDETLEYLLLFSWPGNVRQLANEIRRMIALAEPDAALTPALLSPEIQASRRTVAVPTLTADPEVRVSLDQPLPVAVEKLEQLMVRRALDRTHGRVEEASKLLGISRKGLFLKRRRWGLSQAS